MKLHLKRINEWNKEKTDKQNQYTYELIPGLYIF